MGGASKEWIWGGEEVIKARDGDGTGRKNMHSGGSSKPNYA